MQRMRVMLFLLGLSLGAGSLGAGDGRAAPADATSPRLTGSGSDTASDAPARDASTPAAPAGVAPRVPSDEERRVSARAHYQEGRRFFEKRRFREAISALNRAAALWPRREILFNIGLCHYELGERLEAARNIRRSLEGASPKERRALPRALRDLLSQVGVVLVRVSIRDAEIWIDGRLMGRSAVEHVVLPGEVAVEVRVENRTVARKLIQVEAGAQMQWELDHLGREINLGARDVAGGGRDVPPKVPRTRMRLALGWFAGAAGLALAASGMAVGLGVKTRALHEDYLRSPTLALRADGRRFQLATNLCWGLAGAAAVSAAVLAAFTRFRPERPSAAAIIPVLGPGSIGLVAQF